MRDIRNGLWLIALGVILFAGAQLIADEPAKLNEKFFKEGCVCIGETSDGAAYEKVRVIAITPEGSDYWVFYLDHLEERHQRADGRMIALRLPTERFLERNKVRPGKRVRLKCPETFWGNNSQIASTDGH